MRALFTFLIDIIFPPSEHAHLVRTASIDTLAALIAPSPAYGATALLRYREPLITALIQEAKFHDNGRAAMLLGEMLATYLHGLDTKNMLIVPIPLAHEREWERGYNQVVRIAEAAREHIPSFSIHTNLLEKIRMTPPQTSLSRAARLQNLSGAFTVRENTIPKDTPLILLDDIVTTGATLEEAARALTRAGFSHIERLALAH